jgi:membrane protein
VKTKLKTSAKDIFNILSNDDLYAGAAQLAYSLIMAIIPLIMFLITLAGKLTLPVDSVYSYLEFLLPSQAFQAVDSILQEILNSSNFSLVTLVSTIYFISVGTRGMMRVTNKAFHTVERGPDGNFS